MAKLYPDISHYHPVADWDKVASNCPFLISKATEGTSFIDSTLDSFIEGCEEKEIPYWLYTYLNKGNETEQAKFLVSTCSGKVGGHFVGYILDVEAGNAAADVKKALDYLSGLGVKTMIYTMYSQYDTYKSVITGRPSDCAWWEARYGQDTGSYNTAYPCHDGADLHQYTSKGVCTGISGNCDLNRISGSRKEAWFTAPSETANETTDSADTSSGTAAQASSYKAGQAVTLKGVSLYASATASRASGTKTGTYYLWDSTVKSGRIRITNKAENAGKAAQVTGWINTSDIGAASSGTAKTVSYAVGDKVTVNGTIYGNGDGSGGSIKKTKATMYVVGIVSSAKYKYYIGVATKKGGTRQGWASPEILTK